MATLLTKPLTRQIQHNGQSYKVTLSEGGIRITEKGRRLGVEAGWAEILRENDDNNDGAARVIPAPSGPRALGVADVVAADVLLLLARLSDTAKEASSLVERASELPGILARQRVPPRPSEFELGDWHVEPLLTTKQVGEILNVSTRRVRALPLKSINVGGQVRYRRAELRRFMTREEQEKPARYR